MQHFLRITDFSRPELIELLESALALKKELKTTGKNKPVLERKTLAMIFEKPSLRTRVSFEIGMTQLGGHAIYLGPSDIQMGKRETAYDVGVVTGRMADGIMARTFAHATVEELAQGSSTPVINGLSDLEHPCQVLADYLTIYEHLGSYKNVKIAWLGDGNNNVAHSLYLLSMALGNQFACAAPENYEMLPSIVKEGQTLAQQTKGKLLQTIDPTEAVSQAHVVVTDTWVSMGAEEEAEKRLKVFPPYQVTPDLMKQADKKAIFMHCLPAYRGKEVSAEVIDGPQSVVFDEAENRLHAQKALLVKLLA